MLTFLKLLKFSTYNNFITIVVLSGSCVIKWLQYAFHSILIKNFFQLSAALRICDIIFTQGTRRQAKIFHPWVRYMIQILV